VDESFPVEEGFLSIPFSQMTLTCEEEGGVDLIYRPDGAYERLAQYKKLMIDQPEIWIDRDSQSTREPNRTTSMP